MQLREHAAKIGRLDAFRVDPRAIKIDPAHNIRDMKSERTRAHIEELKISIRAEHGVKRPLEVRMIEDDIFVTDGECRLTAVQELIRDEGFDIKSVLCIHEPAGTDQCERILNFGVSSTAERYTELEMAEWCRRALRAGATEEQIAAAAGWKSKASVTQHLKMLELPEDAKQRIQAGTESATLAMKLQKEDPELVERLRRENEEENRKLGVGQRPKKLTQKKVTKAKEAAKPAPKSDPPKPEPEKTEAQAQTPIMAPNAEVEVAPQPVSFTPLSDETPPHPEPMFRDADERPHEPHPQLQTAAAREFPAAAFEKPRDGVEGLLLTFLNADVFTLATMHAQLVKEHQEAAAQDGATDAQYQLCVAADVIGDLRFPDGWQQAKANSELAEVA